MRGLPDEEQGHCYGGTDQYTQGIIYENIIIIQKLEIYTYIDGRCVVNTAEEKNGTKLSMTIPTYCTILNYQYLNRDCSQLLKNDSKMKTSIFKASKNDLLADLFISEGMKKHYSNR